MYIGWQEGKWDPTEIHNPGYCRRENSCFTLLCYFVLTQYIYRQANGAQQRKGINLQVVIKFRQNLFKQEVTYYLLRSIS
jgi:hypothetical protein